MSISKVVNRIVAAEDCDRNHNVTADNILSHLHSYTYGITSDPLTNFTCVFAGLIHDVDHPGVSNLQLIKEQDEMAGMVAQEGIVSEEAAGPVVAPVLLEVVNRHGPVARGRRLGLFVPVVPVIVHWCPVRRRISCRCRGGIISS